MAVGAVVGVLELDRGGLALVVDGGGILRLMGLTVARVGLVEVAGRVERVGKVVAVERGRGRVGREGREGLVVVRRRRRRVVRVGGLRGCEVGLTRVERVAVEVLHPCQPAECEQREREQRRGPADGRRADDQEHRLVPL